MNDSRSRLDVVSVPGAAPGLSYLDGTAPAAVLMVDLGQQQVVHVNAVARQMAPGVSLPASVDTWAAAAALRDAGGVELGETEHPLLRIARSEPVAGQAVSAARASELGAHREPLWVVALPMGDAPRLEGHVLVVFLPLAQRESAQQAATAAAEQASVKQLELLAAAVLATGLSFTVADAHEPDMPLVYINPAFTATTGYPAEDVLGRNCRFLQGPATDAEAVTRLREGLQAGQEVAVTLLNHRKDGTAFWNHVVVSPIHGPGGELTHFVGIQTDVTAAVEAEAGRAAALAEAQTARDALQQANARLRLLTRATVHLTDGLADATGEDTDRDARAAVAALAVDMVPALGDWCVVTLAEDVPGVLDSDRHNRRGHRDSRDQKRDQSGQRGHGHRHGPQDVAWWHVEDDQRHLVQTYTATRLQDMNPSGPVHTVLRTSRPILTNCTASASASANTTNPASLVEAARDDLRPGTALEAFERLGAVSAAVLPLRGRGRTVGALSLFQGPTRGPLTREQVADAQEVAGRAGLLLHNAALQRQQRDLAVGLQRLMLTDPPHPEHLQVAVRYVPAAQVARVGGDWYDAFTGPQEQFCFVIGDVMGHDTQAAAAMGQLRTMTRTAAVVTDAGPAGVLSAVDAALARLDLTTTASAIVARLKPPHPPSQVSTAAPATARDPAPLAVARLTWSNAGHPPPLLLGADGNVTVLHGAGPDLILGVLTGTDRTEHQVDLPAGAVILLYTDGLVERRGVSLKAGLDRLHEVVASLHPHAMGLDAFVDALLEAMLEPSPADDVAVFAVQLAAGSTSRA